MNLNSTGREGHQVTAPLKSRWLKGSLGGVAMQGVAMALGFLSSVVLARLLGPEGLGEFGFVRSLVAVLSVLAAFGLPTVLTRLVSSYAATGRYSLARGLLRWSNRYVAWLSLLGMIGLLVYGQLQSNRGSWQLYAWAAPLIAVLALTQLRQRALQALHHPILAQLPEQLFKHLVFLGVVGVSFTAGLVSLYSTEGMMALWLIGNLASLGLGMYLLRWVRPRELAREKPTYDTEEWKSIAWPIFLANGLGVFFGNNDTILLGLLEGPEQVGLYQVALQLSGLLVVMLGASNWVLAPFFSKFHEEGDKTRFQSVVTRTGRMIFISTLLMYGVLATISKPFLGFVFGTEYEAAYSMMLILGFGKLIDVGSGPVVTILAMTGGQKELMMGVGMAALSSAILCVLLIPYYGGIGAAAGMALTTGGYNVFLAYKVRQRTGIRATVLG